MKPTIKTLSLIACLTIHAVAFSSNPGGGEANATTPKEVDLKVVLKNIHKAFEDALASDGQYADSLNVLNYLTEVTVTFDHAIAKEVGASLSLFVKIGGKRSNEKTKSVTYSFIPPKKKGITSSTGTNKKAYRQIYEELLSIGTCLEEYKELPYQIKTLELEIGISLIRSKETGLGFEIWSAELSADASREKKTGNTMSLKFEIPASFFAKGK